MLTADWLAMLVPALRALKLSITSVATPSRPSSRAQKPSRASLTAVLGLGVFSTAAALFLYYRILATMGSIAAASQSYLRIVVGVAAGIVFLGETLTPERFGGMVLILAGVVAMAHRPRIAVPPADAR